jgi:uncharacterized membrane protein YhhN
VTAAAWVFAAIFAVAAGANWWSRLAEGRRTTELWSKPLALVSLIGVAGTLDAADPAVRTWFVVALALSLAGDVFLLDGDRRFVPGLVAFLLAHVAYTIGLVIAPDWSWAAFGAALVAVALLVGTVGVQIISAARRSAPVLGPAVTAYLLAISMMFCAAAATGNWIAIVGAALFVASDSVLGWRQFVADARWMPVTIMITYHLGQAGLVASLL